MEKLKLSTPCCNRQVGVIDIMLYASINVKRTCPKCKTRYSVTIRPHTHNDSMAIHIVDWTKF